MTISKEQITAALRKLGPSSPGALADHLQVERSALSPHIGAMLVAKELKAAGVTKSRRIALPDQKIYETTTRSAPKKSKRAPAKKPKKSRKKSPARAPNAAAEPEVLPAFTADDRLVLVRGAQPPLIFSPADTQAIATLLCSHFEA
jgi:hypothetical protein